VASFVPDQRWVGQPFFAFIINAFAFSSLEQKLCVTQSRLADDPAYQLFVVDSLRLVKVAH
jgi:hypothetical protein